MKLIDYKFITDENIQGKVVEHLITSGYDIFDIKKEGLSTMSDDEILELAIEKHRVIITQDSDFGTTFFQSGFQLTGIIYVRPGHVNSQDVIKIIDTLFSQNIEIDIPFIIVAELVKHKVKIRVRPLLINLE
jgi:predicted nuclease of predicted toxin-antitoxin system